MWQINVSIRCKSANEIIGCLRCSPDCNSAKANSTNLICKLMSPAQIDQSREGL